MSIAATVPEFTWSDIAYALTPNGSNLDYVANAAYLSGGHRVGVQKQSWNALALPRGHAARLLRAARQRSRPRTSWAGRR